MCRFTFTRAEWLAKPEEAQEWYIYFVKAGIFTLSIV
jgi:hypothetical protein